MNEPSGHLRRPLGPGGSIGHWQIGDVAEEPYDVPWSAMQGDMDPFFFLTKHRNFIPHEYPCRTIFAENFRGRRPEVRGRFDMARFWLPFGSPRVDLSGFWFRPTRIAAWARTTIEAQTAGTAEFSLGTCGGAVIWINGTELGWLAPYSRNLEAQSRFTVDLQAGPNTIEIFFDDLAERDARFFFQLNYVAGPAISVALPTPVAGRVADGIEQALEALHFDQTHYLGGPVSLILPHPVPVDTTVHVAIGGDFISHEQVTLERVLAAGATSLDLGPSEAMPADFRHFDITFNAGGFVARRTLAVEICHVERHGSAPDNLSARIDEALETVAEYSEPDTSCALARLATGKGGAETNAMIAAALPSIEACHDCSDFTLVPLLWARSAFADAIDPALLQRIDSTIVGYRYWMDEPGNDVQWYFSENHALLFHTAAYLGGHLLPDAVFTRSGRTGAEQSAIGAARVRAWLDHFETWGMAEFNSAPYFPIDFKGLTALAALAPDPDIAARAKESILQLLEIVARSSHQGMMTAAQGRSYEHTLCAGRSLELSAIARLVWGRGWFGRRVHALAQLAMCLRDHGLIIPDRSAAIALHDGADHEEWRFAQGQDRFARLYHYKARHFAMGSPVHYRWGEWGYQETVLHLRLGDAPEAAIWINHPGEAIQFGAGRPSYWGGCGNIPRVHQYRGLAVLQFLTHSSQPDFTHAWFPRDRFDDSRVAGPIAMACSGGGAVLLKGSGDFNVTSEGPSAGAELRLSGENTLWIVRIAGTDDLDALRQAFAPLEISMSADGVWQVNDPHYGPVIFHPDGVVEAEGRRIDPNRYSIAGDAITLPDFALPRAPVQARKEVNRR